MKTTLAINFLNTNATVKMQSELFTAIEHEEYEMTIQMLNNDISRLKTRITNLENNEDKDADAKEVELKALKAQLAETEKTLDNTKKSCSETQEIYDKVITAMTQENHDHFKNDKDAVRTVLRVLATWDNSKLVKYAIIPAFQSQELYNCLETIHINSKASEDGALVMSKEVKEAYKTASKELDAIIKKTFSLPFETPYTDKTRVKMTAEDRKLLNDCYVKGFKNKFSTNKIGITKFEEREINTLVRVKKNKKTGKTEYDYSGLATTIANIVIRHYFK